MADENKLLSDEKQVDLTQNEQKNEEKVEKITLEELIYNASKIISGKIKQEDLNAFGNKLTVRTYLPILDKMRAMMTLIFDMNNQDVEMEEIRVVSLRKNMFFNVLLAEYAMIDVSNKDLQTYQTYDLLYPIFAPFILQYCEKDYNEMKEMIQESLNIYAMKDLDSLLSNINYQALAKSAKKNEELLNKMASDKEALKEIRELYEALSKSQNADKATEAIKKLTQLEAIRTGKEKKANKKD